MGVSSEELVGALPDQHRRVGGVSEREREGDLNASHRLSQATQPRAPTIEHLAHRRFRDLDDLDGQAQLSRGRRGPIDVLRSGGPDRDQVQWAEVPDPTRDEGGIDPSTEQDTGSCASGHATREGEVEGPIEVQEMPCVVGTVHGTPGRSNRSDKT